VLKKEFLIGDIVWVYTEKPKTVEEEGNKKLGKFKRLWTHWRGPYFVVEVKGDNVLVAKGGASKESQRWVNQVRVRRYLYPLRGLADEGVKRGGYINQIIGRKLLRGSIQYQVVWVTPQGEKKEWIREGLVPYSLVQRYFEVLRGQKDRKQLHPRFAPGEPEKVLTWSREDPEWAVEREQEVIRRSGALSRDDDPNDLPPDPRIEVIVDSTDGDGRRSVAGWTKRIRAVGRNH
jgi:hypothetical protein